MAMDTDAWLVWLGVKSPQVSQSQIDKYVAQAKEHVGDYADFEQGVADQESFTSWQSHLESEGFTSGEASNFVDLVKNNFTDEDGSGTAWDEYKAFVTNTADTYPQFKANFGGVSTFGTSATTADGEPIAGVRVHEQDGLSYSGVPVPAGTTEVFGRNIHLTQQDTQSIQEDVTFANLRTDAEHNSAYVGTSITVMADATNPNSSRVSATVTLQEDGSVAKQQNVSIPADSTTTVEFEVTKNEYICLNYGIENLGPISVCWAPSIIR